jgi:hypothetical protein
VDQIKKLYLEAAAIRGDSHWTVEKADELIHNSASEVARRKRLGLEGQGLEGQGQTP